MTYLCMHNIHLDSQYLHGLFGPDLSHSPTLDLVRLEHRIERLLFRLPAFSSTSTSTTPYRYGNVGQGDSDLGVILDQIKHKHCRLGSENLNNPTYIRVASWGIPGEGDLFLFSSNSKILLYFDPFSFKNHPVYSLIFFHILWFVKVLSWDFNSIENASSLIFSNHLVYFPSKIVFNIIGHKVVNIAFIIAISALTCCHLHSFNLFIQDLFHCPPLFLERLQLKYLLLQFISLDFEVHKSV